MALSHRQEIYRDDLLYELQRSGSAVRAQSEQSSSSACRNESRPSPG